MSLAKFTNNASTTLASPITSAATSLSVTSGGGALFPALTGGQYFRATIMHIVSGAVTAFEIVKVSGRSTDTMSPIVRGQEGTTAQAWAAGDTFTLLPTAADLSGFVQFDDLQAQGGNYAPDTGAANAYAVALSPALTAHVVGMPIRWKAAHTNTAASTFNDGVGATTLTFPDGTALTASTITSGGLYTTVWDGAKFQLLSPDLSAYALTSALSAYALVSALAAYAPINNPTFTGYQRGVTASSGDSSVQFATTAFVNRGSSLAVNGYRKNPDGSIDQWGLVANGGVGPTTVTFPITFPTECLNLVSQCVNVQGTIDQTNVTASGFISTNGALGSSTYWRAIGH